MRTPAFFLIFPLVVLPLLPASAEKKNQQDSTQKDAPVPPKRAWVGVATVGIDSSLRRHLELEEGFGIQVAEVMPDSPAGKSGIRSNDIITHFGDQRLISPEHLSLLVRTKASGDKVSMTIIRKGKEEVLEMTLGETDAHHFNRWHSPESYPHGYQFPPLSKRSDPGWQDSIQRHQDLMREWMDRNRPESKESHPDRKTPDDKQEDSRKRDESDRAPSGNQPPSISVSPGFPLRVFGAEGVLKIDNEKGELTLTRKDGNHHLEIKDAGGKIVHEGAFDPAGGTESLPEEARRQLEIMKLDNFEILMPETPAATPEKTREKEGGRRPEPPGEIL